MVRAEKKKAYTTLTAAQCRSDLEFWTEKDGVITSQIDWSPFLRGALIESGPQRRFVKSEKPPAVSK